MTLQHQSRSTVQRAWLGSFLFLLALHWPVYGDVSWQRHLFNAAHACTLGQRVRGECPRIPDYAQYQRERAALVHGKSVASAIQEVCAASGQLTLATRWTEPVPELPLEWPERAAGFVASDLALRLQQRLHALRLQHGAPAISVALVGAQLGYWTDTQGLARTYPAQTADGETLFYWSSIAKPLTATVVLQLVEEGKLALDDRLARWYPQVSQAQHISIAHLLAHTSGVADGSHNRLGDLGRREEVLERLGAGSELFCPGTRAQYSNTGYEILAWVIEAVERKPYHEVLAQRVARPLGLASLRALQPDEVEVRGLASGHRGQEVQADPYAWQRVGSGNVIATAPDMLRFWQALLQGRFLRPDSVRRQWAQLHTLENLPPSPRAVSGFGLGVALTVFTDALGQQRLWLNHLGGIPSTNAVVAYDVGTQVFIAVVVNNAVSAPAVAYALLDDIRVWRTNQAER